MAKEPLPYENITVLKWTEQGLRETIRPVVREIPLTIYLNNQEIVTLLCLGDYPETLAVGFLLSEGLLSRRRDLRAVLVEADSGVVRVEAREDTRLREKLYLRRTITSGCGKGTTFYHSLDALTTKKVESGLQIRTGQVFDLMKKMTDHSELYKLTGGTHNSALAALEGLVIFRADIGRHNAVDKIFGECFLEDIPLEDKILITTGRITSEILIKTARMGIPVLISRSAATTLAISLARQIGVTLIGYVRGKNLIVYTGPDRVSY